VSRSLKVAALVSISTAGLLFAAMQHARTLRANRVLHQLPSTARAVLRIDTSALEHTPAAKTLLAAFVPDEQLSEIEAVCGLDPIRGLTNVTAWVRGPEEQPFQSTGLMLQGRTVDAEALAECHRLLVETRGGSIVRIDSGAGPLQASRDRQSAIGLLDGRTIVTGSVRTVAEAMAVGRGAVPALAERPLMAELWRKVSMGAGIVAILDPPVHWKSALQRVMKLGSEPSAIEGAQTVAVSVEAGSAQTLELHIVVIDERLAEQDAELIRAWVASPPDSVEPPWTKLLQSARVRVRDRTIVVTLDVSSLSNAQ
jgi:hypothetical protein